MCGIAGFVSGERIFSSEDLSVMTNTLIHRGPNAEGFYFNGRVGLGHRRLSILDLSAAGNQPFYSASGKTVTVYNGEVYNFRELAKELNISLRTSTDTEVLVEAYEKLGPDLVSRLNGMYSFALYDLQEDVFYLYRGRVGKKPLYYSWDGSNLVFASELKALTALPAIRKSLKPDYTALNTFLHLGYIPEPQTGYKNIRKFPSGSYLKLKDNKLEIIRYWDPAQKISKHIITDFNEAKVKLKELVESSVKSRLMSDVPMGTFLSGGIDSSLVTAIASKYTSGPLNTFSIGFEDKEFNELPYARAVAAHLKTNHHEFIVSEQDALDCMEKVLDNFDEPFADASVIPTYLIANLAKKHITMVLSGDGGDELFLGYGSYTWAKRLSNPLFTSVRKPFSFLFKNLGNSRLKRVGQLLNYKDRSVIKSHIFSQEQYYFKRTELAKLLNPDYVREFSLEENYQGLERKLQPEEEQALFDIKYYLKDDLLAKVDRATMSCSLEARCPLLDYRIVEFALNISPELKVHEGQKKYLLREVLFDYVPREYFDREKRGFSIPLGRWLKSDLRVLLEDYLSREKIKETGIFNYQYIETLKARFLSKENYLYNRLWILIVLQRWLLNNKNNF